MKSVNQRSSSLLYIPVFSLCLANPLNAASWTDTVSDYARWAWGAMPTREQATQQVNPLNWNITPEQRQRLFYAGVAGTLGLGAGAVAYNYLYNNAPTSKAQNEKRAVQVIQSFHDKRKNFNSLSPADKINILKQIWEIEEDLSRQLSYKKTTTNFADNTLIPSLKYIANFLISNLNIQEHNALIDQTKPLFMTQNLLYNNVLKEINDKLQKKQNAATYYQALQDKQSHTIPQDTLKNIQIEIHQDNLKDLKAKIQNPKLVLPEDHNILMSLYNELKTKFFNQPSSEQPSEPLDISAGYFAPQQKAHQSPSLAAVPVYTETPVQTQAPSNVPATEPSITTSPRSEPITPSPAQQTSPQAPIPTPRTAQTSRTINDLKNIDISQENAAATIIKELSDFAPADEEQKEQLKKAYDQKREALQLFDELKKINHPNELQKFTEKLNNNKDLSYEDKETLKKEITQKIKSLTPSTTKVTSRFKKETPESNPSAISSTSADTDTQGEVSEPVLEKPSLIGEATPAKTLEQRTAHITVRITLIPGIEKAQTLRDLEIIKQQFEGYNKDNINQQDINAFQAAYDTKYQELMQQQFESAKTLGDLETVYKNYKSLKDNAEKKNIELFNTAHKQRTQQIKFRMKLTQQIFNTQNLNDLQQLKETFNDHKNELNQTDIKILQQAYNKKYRELTQQLPKQPSQASAPLGVTPQLTPTSNVLHTAAPSTSNNPTHQKEPIGSKEAEKEPEETPTAATRSFDTSNRPTSFIDIPQETIEPLLTIKGQVPPPYSKHRHY